MGKETKSCSTLFPGQIVETPSTKAAAMMLVVQLALEAFIDVIDIFETFFDEQIAGLLGALTTSADKYYGGATLLSNTYHTAQYELTYLGGEVRIDHPVRLVYPGDVYGSLRVTHE